MFTCRGIDRRMAEPLFYSEQLVDPGASLTLAGYEARHAAASRRLQAGDNLWLFNGRGDIARATLLRVAERGRRLELRIEERRREAAPPQIHLACALPKGERQTILLDMATQLGMTRFTPLECARSIVKPGANSRTRWEKICLEACKQSRRLHLPVVEAPRKLEELAHDAKQNIWIAHPQASSFSAAWHPFKGEATILVGPEGGFTEAEVETALSWGATAVSLGAGILRIETAAVALLAAIALRESNAA